jgi:hypothetical protein
MLVCSCAKNLGLTRAQPSAVGSRKRQEIDSLKINGLLQPVTHKARKMDSKTEKFFCRLMGSH